MTFATIQLIHALLTDHVDYLEDLLQDAGRMLQETCAAHEEDAEQGVEEARKAIDAAMERKAAIAAEQDQVLKALGDFETHDWH